MPLRALLTRLLRRSAPPATRLCPREAAAIAEQAAASAGHPGTYGHAVPVRAGGAVAWDVSQVSIGSGWRVRVDDATGEPGPVTRWGLR